MTNILHRLYCRHIWQPQRLQAVKTAPECRAGCAGGNCPPDWMPSSADRCSAACAKVAIPFWQRCGKMLTESKMGGMDAIGVFVHHCPDPGHNKCPLSPSHIHAQLVTIKTAPECRPASFTIGIPNWMPDGNDNCSRACAKIVNPFWEQCGARLMDPKSWNDGGVTEIDKMTKINAFYQRCYNAVHYISKNCTLYDGKHGTWPTLHDKSARAKECCAPGETWNGVAHSKCTLCTPGQY
eukprot:COSAG01_NODE_25123_length_754_cov_22.123664_1_plen_237_part_10